MNADTNRESIYFAVRDADGRIVKYGSCQRAVLNAQREAVSHKVIEAVVDDRQHYIDPATDEVHDLRDMTPAVALVAGVCTITNLPPKTTVVVNHFDSFTIPDGVFEITFSAGVYELVASAPTYNDWKHTVEV